MRNLMHLCDASISALAVAVAVSVALALAVAFSFQLFILERQQQHICKTRLALCA